MEIDPPNVSSSSNDEETSEIITENYFSSIYFESKNPNLIGFAFLNNSKKKFYICEFYDNLLYSILESILLQVRPKCICINTEDTSSIYIKKIIKLIELCEIRIIECPHRYFDASLIEQDFSRLLQLNDSTRNYINHFNKLIACKALAAILYEWSIMSDNSFFNKCELSEYSTDEFLQLDKAAFAALLLLPKEITAESHRRPTSLLGLLNKCRTSFASKRLRSWISQPLVDVERICKRHDIIEVLMMQDEMRQMIHSVYLKKTPDLDKLIPKFHKMNSGVPLKQNKLTLEDIVKLYDCVVDTSKLLLMLSNYRGIHQDTIVDMFVSPLNECVDGFTAFKSLVEETIDLKEAENGNFVISRKFDKNLLELMEEKEAIESKMEELRLQLEDELLSNNGRRVKSSRDEKEIIKIIEDNSFGFLFRVTKKDQPAIHARKDVIQSIRLNKSEFLFTHHKLKSLCKRHETNAFEYKRCQNALMEKALSVASTHWPVLERLADVLSMIDILTAFAAVSASAPIPYTRPYVSDTRHGCLKLIGCRHALMEAQSRSTAFIANDIIMDFEASRLHIITGPNMGGKSTYIRQVALNVLLCQIGCFVPCQQAEIPIFKQISCRVGASDIQLRGVSTFLAEMVEASAIIKTAGEKSLVLIDELGRGTSTFEGFGLAWGIAKHLCEISKCFCLFATHFHEMGELANDCKGVINSYVEAAVERPMKGPMKLTFLYKMRDGCCDQSYGVEVAKMAGMPEEVVLKAQRKSYELEAVGKWQAKRKHNNNNNEAPLHKLKCSLNNLFCLDSADSFSKTAQLKTAELTSLVATPYYN